MPLNRKIIWRKSALLYLEKSIDYIREDSVKNANIAANAIWDCIEKASRFPEHFPPDKYKLNNTGLSGYLKFTVSGSHFMWILI